MSAAPAVLGLASITPPALFLVPLAVHARAELDVDARRRRKPEALGHFDQVELVHVKDRSEPVARICLQVGAVAVFG